MVLSAFRAELSLSSDGARLVDSVAEVIRRANYGKLE